MFCELQEKQNKKSYLGHMGYWLRPHEGERNNCFGKSN